MGNRGGLEFLRRIQNDERALTSHISIVAAIILSVPDVKPNISSFNISRRKIMDLAHIKGIATYHRCINNLIEWGYIKYIPSFNPEGKTEVWIINENGGILNDIVGIEGHFMPCSLFSPRTFSK